MKTIILGAGFAGLSAGIKTGASIYEATEAPGGICNSYIKKGYEFFNGGPHLLFGKGPGLDYIKSMVEVNEYERRSGVYINKIFPYPFQSYAQRLESANPGTLKRWLQSNFSQAECNLFFYPFNRKYTAGLDDVVIQDEDYKTPKAGEKGFAVTFCDPKEGLGSLVNKMSSKCDIKYGKKAIGVDTINRIVFFEDGTNEKYDRLISTIPLSQLMYLCKNPVNLIYSSVYVLNIGAEKTEQTPKEHWLYVPFCNTGFHRLGFYSNVDETKAPEGKVNMSVEIAFNGYEKEDLDEPFIAQEVIKELQEWRIIGDVDVVDGTWVKYAYTWLRDVNIRDYALAWLKDNNILSIGRYGKWKFQGIVNSIEDGLSI